MDGKLMRGFRLLLASVGMWGGPVLSLYLLGIWDEQSDSAWPGVALIAMFFAQLPLWTLVAGTKNLRQGRRFGEHPSSTRFLWVVRETRRRLKQAKRK
jgi:hypothetical protein